MKNKAIVLQVIINIIAVLSLMKSLLCFGILIVTIQQTCNLVGFQPYRILEYFRMNPYEISTTMLFFAIAIYLLFQGIGLLRKEHYGRILAFLFPVVLLLIMVISKITIVGSANIIISISYGAFLLIFFNLPKVKKQFK